MKEAVYCEICGLEYGSHEMKNQKESPGGIEFISHDGGIKYDRGYILCGKCYIEMFNDITTLIKKRKKESLK